MSENERTGMININNLKDQYHNEPSSHSLRFEAYELPKPSKNSSSTDLVPIPEPSYGREMHRASSAPFVSDTSSSELKLRLDGVQKKWGKPTYSTPTSSASNQKPVNGVDEGSNVNSKTRDDSKRSQVGISSEKQKLAASLFGGSSSSSHRRSSSSGHKAPPKSRAGVVGSTSEKNLIQPPPPDLLELSEPTGVMFTPPTTIDPFKQLEGLIDSNQVSSSGQTIDLMNPQSTNEDK